MGSWCWERYFGGGGPTGRGDSSQGAPCSFGVREGGGLGSSTVTCCWLPPLKRRNPHEVGCWSGFRPRYNSARAIRLRRMTSGGADLCSPMQHPSSMAFYRARPSADTLKQDELHAARRTVFGEMEKTSGGEVVDAAALAWVCGRPMPTSRSVCRKQWRERPNTIYLGPPQSAIIEQP